MLQSARDTAGVACRLGALIHDKHCRSPPCLVWSIQFELCTETKVLKPQEPWGSPSLLWIAKGPHQVWPGRSVWPRVN